MSHRLTTRPALALAFAALIAAPVLSAKAQLPAVVAYGARVAYNTIATPTKVTRDAAGDIFAYGSTGTTGIYEFPANGPQQLVVASTDPSLTNANPGFSVRLAADPAGNLFVAQYTYSFTGVVYEIPRNANGTYGTSVLVATGATGFIGGFYRPIDIAVDSSDDIYFIYDTGAGTGKGIAVLTSNIANPAGTNGRFLVGSSSVAENPLATSLNLDNSGNLFYADGTNIWEITASGLAASGTPTPTVIATGNIVGGSAAIATPKYVFADPAGNLYVNNGTAVYVIANNSGFSAGSLAYTLPTTVSGASGGLYGAVDNQGNLILDYNGSLEFYGGSKLYTAPSSNAYAGTYAVGGGGSGTTTKSPSFGLLFTTATYLSNAAGSAANTYYFDNAFGAAYGAAGTGTNVFTSSSTTCAAGTSYAAGATCAVEVGYKPYQAGAFASSLNIYGGPTAASTNLLTSLSAFGIATGPNATIDTGYKTAVGGISTYTVPTGIAIDNTGAMYVADSTKNLVYKFASGSTSSSSSAASYGTGLSAPSGVAIDPAGNLYIVDTGNNRIVYFVNNNGTFGSQTVLSTGSYTLNSPHGIAVDAFGNLYIADTGNSRVLITTNPTQGAVGTTYPVGSGFTAPYGIAVDALFNVYVADKGANAVYEVPGGYALTASASTNVGSGVVTTVGSGFSSPTGVAVDASGSVYVADGGNSKVWRVPFTSNAFATPVALFTATASGIARPFGIATDLSGDLYFTDADVPGVYFVQRSAVSGSAANTLAFGSVAVNGTSTLTATLANAGYQTALTNSLSTAPAAPYATGTNNCGASLNTGASCTVSVTFTGPATTDTNQAGSMTFTTNELNGTTSPTTKVTLSGQSTGGVNSVTITGNNSPVYGVGETYNVTAADSAGNPASVSGSYSVTITNISTNATTTASVTLTNGTGSFLLPNLNVASYTLTTTVGSSASNTFPITVGKGTLLAMANNVSRLFDVANPTFTYTYSGFANGDTASVVTGTPTVSTTATRVSPAGTYALTISGTLTASNYNITENNGTLTVTGSVPQSILFTPLPPLTHGTAYTLTGLATSGLPVRYSATNATVSGNTITPTAAGTVTVTAFQSGNGTYAAATPVSRSFTAQ